MQGQNQRRPSQLAQSRKISQEERSPNLMFTVLTIGTVVLLLAVTFVGDWLRIPEISISSSTQLISPNQDGSFENATVVYQLSEETEISAVVLSQGGGIVRNLLEAQAQTAGQHFLVWDGMDNAGLRAQDGSYQIELTAQGAVRAKTSNVAVLVDTLPPGLQLVNLQDGTRVRDSLLVIEGITEPDSTIWLNGAAQPVLVDGTGRFRTQQKLVEGSNVVDVKAIDPAGNTTALARNIELVTAAPQVVISSPAEGAWMNTPLVTVEGQAPVGTMLKINDQAVSVAPDGSFRYDVLLEEGDQRILVTAADDVGNLTTVERYVRVKTQGPNIELNIAEGVAVSDPVLQLTGKTSPGSTVLVNQRDVTVGALGDFHTSVQLIEGDNSIQVEARDQAGNATNLNRRVRYEIPTKPSEIERLTQNLNELPVYTIPAILLLSMALGLFLYRQNQLDVQLTVDSQEFTPGLPQESKNMTFWLDLNHSANVTVEVIDSNGQVQARLLDNRRRTARQHVFLWDGYDDFGRLVIPGVYTVRAIAGAPPIKVASAVQIRIEEDVYVSRKTSQYDEAQLTSNLVQRRRLRQNRKRI